MNKSSTLFFALLAACGVAEPSADVTSELTPMAQSAAPAGADFILAGTRFTAGHDLTLQVSKAPANATVIFSYTTAGLGDGPCPASFGGSCFSMRAPIEPVETKLFVNHNGYGTIDMPLPASLEGEYLSIQAVVYDGAMPVELSNPISSLVAPSGSGGGNFADNDLDGFSRSEGDCDDLNANFAPDAPDAVGDGFDTNCDAVDGVDADYDGVASIESGGTDCDDTNGAVFPGNIETCDGLDNTCNGVPDKEAGALVCDATVTFSAVKPVPADILFVVESTGNSTDVQDKLAASANGFFTALEAAEIDAHVGIISTNTVNPADSGKLKETVGYRFADLEEAGVDNSTMWFNQILGNMAAQGNNPGTGRRAAGLALNAPLVTGFNDGFVRANSDLHVVFVSDQDDGSGGSPSVTLFEDALVNAKAPYAGTAHAIAVPSNAACGTPGHDYATLAANTTGLAGSACKDDFDEFHTNLVDFMAESEEARVEFEFEAGIDPDTLSMSYMHNGFRVRVSSDHFSWDFANATATLDDPAAAGIPADAILEATYNLY